MIEYKDNHWVHEPALTLESPTKDLLAASRDVDDAGVITNTMVELFLTEGTDSDAIAMVRKEVDETYADNPLGGLCKDHQRYFRAEVRTAQALVAALTENARFLARGVDIMVAHINEHGSHEEL